MQHATDARMETKAFSTAIEVMTLEKKIEYAMDLRKRFGKTDVAIGLWSTDSLKEVARLKDLYTCAGYTVQEYSGELRIEW